MQTSAHDDKKSSDTRATELSLFDQVNNLEQEARMVLPAVQTLFGFQLIAGFNETFRSQVTTEEKMIHLVALLLVGLSGVLVVAPAAYHRQAQHKISEHFVKISTRFLSLALLPLAIGTCLDIYLISKILGDSRTLAKFIALLAFATYAGVWFIYPHYSYFNRRQRREQGNQEI